jgi:hypothetical protein
MDVPLIGQGCSAVNMLSAALRMLSEKPPVSKQKNHFFVSDVADLSFAHAFGARQCC